MANDTGALDTRTMKPAAAGQALERALRGFRGELTIADASARSGLALRDAEAGLHQLVGTYNGNLAATEKGELLFRFSDGFVKPPETRAWRKALTRVSQAASGIGRFVVRAWVSIALVGYVAIFAVVLIGLALRDDDGFDIGDLLGFLLRIIFDAMFWTFHPFSPFRLTAGSGWGYGGGRGRLGRGRTRNKVPFYQRVNQFVFGPDPEKVDPKRPLRLILAAIRHQAGRIGLGDVMRVTGLPRGQADAQMSRLLLDYNGDVEVSEEGAITYTFSELRVSADDEGERNPTAFWRKPVTVPAVTGNTAGTNLMLGALNGFNLLVSTYALANDLTISRLGAMLTMMASRARDEAMVLPPPDGVPWALGVVPFVFSSALFALPLWRRITLGKRQSMAQAENGRRAVAAHVLDAPQEFYAVDDLKALFAVGAGRQPQGKELDLAVQTMGGSFDLDKEGVGVYRFEDLARERQALSAARAQAPRDEARPGQVVFSSDN